MWHESSAKFALSKQNNDSQDNLINPALIESVASESIGEALGFEAGDQLLSINGVRPRDLIDYKFLIVEEELNLEVLDASGTLHNIHLEKEPDDGLGLTFTDALFDGLNQCNNNCSFCFIDQQPSGHRTSLYLKDDDYRLSFLYGSYLTLTNLKQSDWKRIESQRLSPLFVSVHATDPELRARMLKNSRAGLLLDQLNWFAERNLQIHAQIVVCPGLNDGKALNQTLNDLAGFSKGDWPVVLSTAVVPVGLTRFRPENDGLIPVNVECACKVIKQVELLQKQFKEMIGSNFAWLSDEWYLIAGQPLPQRNAYEDLPQQENGVGSIRAFLEKMDIATATLPNKLQTPKTCSWVVGRIVEKSLVPATRRLNKIEGLTLHLYGLPSPYWGQEQVVTGLLTGEDLVKGLKKEDLGEQLLLPSLMLKQGQAVFLDDMSLEELRNALQIPIRIVNGADDIVAAAIEDLEKVL